MGRDRDDDSWDEDGWQAEEDEADLPEGVYSDDEEEPTVECPYCRRQIHEEAPCCPYCENYISQEDAPPSSKPWWFIIAAILCLGIACLWILGG